MDIGYLIAIKQEKQWNSYNMGGVGWRWAGGMATATSEAMHVGTLVLDMYDKSKQQLVWPGSATKTLNPSTNQESSNKLCLDLRVSRLVH